MIHRTFAPLALAVVAMALALALGATPAAADNTFQAELDGTKAGTASTGTGSGQVFLNDAQDSALVDLTWSGLGSAAIAWHIHCGDPAAIVFDPLSSEPTTSSLKWVPTAQDVTDLKAGLCYFNVHSVDFPGGEIRGNLASSVGGVAELPEVTGAPLQATGSSGGNAGLIAGLIAAVVAGAVALGGAAWYVRRRPA